MNRVEGLYRALRQRLVWWACIVLSAQGSAAVAMQGAVEQGSKTRSSTATSVSGYSDYSQGLEAYIVGDYLRAQSHWVEAAKLKHARAMFNLGLLHQQQRVPGASEAKAKRWFELAGQAGYAAADYHHGLMLLAESNSAAQAEGRKYLRRAAKAGYDPARQRLKKMPQHGQLESSPEVTVARTSSSAPLGTDPDASQPRYLSESWLVQRASTGWTIQLLAFTELEKVKEFVDAHRLHQHAAYFAESAADQTLYKLVYGAYDTKSEAAAAREELKPALQEYGPWLRSLQSVQTAINDR